MSATLLTSLLALLPSTGLTHVIGDVPDGVVGCVAITAGGGSDKTRYFGQTTGLENPLIVVRVSAASYETGYAACNTIKDSWMTLSSGDVKMIKMRGQITDLGRDQNRHHHFTMLFELTVKE